MKRPKRNGFGRKAMAAGVALAALAYFALPLAATFLFSLKGKKDVLGFAAYASVFSDPRFLATFLFSLRMALATIAAGLVLVVPTTILVVLRLPKAKALLEFLSMVPFTVPPVVLAFGLIRVYSAPPFSLAASPALLCAAYVVLCFPYLYRSTETGLRALDAKRLWEASRVLGAGPLRTLFLVLLPNLRSALAGAAFLTFSVVMGELTVAVLLAWPAFGPYMALVGRDKAYEPAALSIISFGLTWMAIMVIQVLSTRTKGAASAPVLGH